MYSSTVIKALKTVGKLLVPPSDHPTSTATVALKYAGEPRDDCDHELLDVEDKQEESDEKAIERLGGSINVDRELARISLKKWKYMTMTLMSLIKSSNSKVCLHACS